MSPQLSSHFTNRQPSPIRLAQIEFMKRSDQVQAINAAIGNVTLPMHPAMQKRMFELSGNESPFKAGVVKYSATVGEKETTDAVLQIIAASGFPTKDLFVQITDGGSQAMELLILGVCGPAGSPEKPLMMIDAAYSNYLSMAERTGRRTVSLTRHLADDGHFSLPTTKEIEALIETEKPGALLVIPYDNPTGQFYNQESLNQLAKLCVKHDLWLVSDEAYRELEYTDSPTSSVWGITEKDVPGITGRRISLESASKVWNACGLRIGALVTDNQKFHQQSVAENTANLCPNVIGQYIFGALLHESLSDLQRWFSQQRSYYEKISHQVTQELKLRLPKAIVSKPDAAIYSVVDLRQMVDTNFQMSKFVMYCATQGKVKIDDQFYTLLVSPMDGFYSAKPGLENPGCTQLRIAYVETPDRLKLVPQLLEELVTSFLAK